MQCVRIVLEEADPEDAKEVIRDYAHTHDPLRRDRSSGPPGRSYVKKVYLTEHGEVIHEETEG